MQSDSRSISAALLVQRPEGNTDKRGIGPLKVIYLSYVHQMYIFPIDLRGLCITCLLDKSLLFKVTFELASDKNGFSTNKKPAKSVLQKAHLAEQIDGERGLRVRDHRRDPSPNERIHPAQSLQLPHSRSRSTSPHARYQASPHRLTQYDAEEPSVLLHTLLIVPHGKDLNCAPLQPNVYLNCKFLGSDEAARSAVSWGQKHPTFSFVQVSTSRRDMESS